MELPTHILTASTVIKNQQNQYLMLKHLRRGWEFPGGIIERGEDLLAGLSREVKEETGVMITHCSLIGLYSNIKEKPGYNGVKTIPPLFVVHFIADYLSGSPHTSEESLQVKWLDQNQVLAYMTNEADILRMQDTLNFAGRIYHVTYKNPPFEMINRTQIF